MVQQTAQPTVRPMVIVVHPPPIHNMSPLRYTKPTPANAVLAGNSHVCYNNRVAYGFLGENLFLEMSAKGQQRGE